MQTKKQVEKEGDCTDRLRHNSYLYRRKFLRWVKNTVNLLAFVVFHV